MSGMQIRVSTSILGPWTGHTWLSHRARIASARESRTCRWLAPTVIPMTRHAPKVNASDPTQTGRVKLSVTRDSCFAISTDPSRIKTTDSWIARF